MVKFMHIKSKTLIRFAFLILTGVAVASGCSPIETPVRTPIGQPIDPNAIRTEAAQTVIAQLPPSATPEPPTQSPTREPPTAPPATDTPSPTDTPSLPRIILAHFTEPPDSCPGLSPMPGIVRYSDPGNGGLRATIELSGLAPQHVYKLTLNEQADYSGELSSCGTYYCDFQDVVTGSDGSVTDAVGLDLPPGDYHVKFLVKDPSNPSRPYCIALFNNDFEFSVR